MRQNWHVEAELRKSLILLIGAKAEVDGRKLSHVEHAILITTNYIHEMLSPQLTSSWNEGEVGFDT
jgi:hypothetical protein